MAEGKDLDRKRRVVTWGDAVLRLESEYQKAQANAYVRKPLAYAAYHLWRWLDTHEKRRPTKGFEEDDEIEDAYDDDAD